MKSIHALLFVLSAVVVPASMASASHDSPLLTAACEYRDAVQQFDRAVHQVHFIDQYDVRIVHQLEAAACEMHSAAGHPERIDRVLYQWQEVQSMHRRAAAAIFGRACYPRHPVLIKYWQRVSCAYEELAKQMECICNDHHVYRPQVGGRYGTTFGLPPVRQPHAAIPRAVPHAGGLTIPRTPYPSNTLPHSFAPPAAQFDNHIRPRATPPNPRGPTTDEIRYFGQRNLDRSRSSRYNVDSHFTGHDLRSAMIGAMLSRLSH